MPETALGVALVPLASPVARGLERVGMPSYIAEIVDLYACLAEMMRRRNLVYLTLPAAVAVISEHPCYEPALTWGRGFYYDDLHEVDETTGQLRRVPRRWVRADILEVLNEYLFPDDLRLAAVVPIAWRVGLCVGWLSGLAVSQKDDAHAGLVMLSALVAPMVSTSGNQKEVSHGKNKACLSSASTLIKRG